MRVLVTGGAGLIGSHTVDLLIDDGHEVVVLDDFSRGCRENVNPKARLRKVDILNRPEVLAIAYEFRASVVMHFAAQVSVPESNFRPYEDAQVNVLGTLNVLAATRPWSRLIFAASGGTCYGDRMLARETDPLVPMSPYAVSKQAAERYVLMMATNAISLRYANVYGPRQSHVGMGAVANFVRCRDLGIAPTIDGDGTAVRDYVHVYDVARANVLAMRSDYRGVMNIGTGIGTSVNRLAAMICGDGPAMYRPGVPGSVTFNTLNNGLSTKVLGWRPAIDIKSGLEML